MFILSCFFYLFLWDLDARDQFEKATTEKLSCEEEVTRSRQTVELAKPLVLGSEVSEGWERRGHPGLALGKLSPNYTRNLDWIL